MDGKESMWGLCCCSEVCDFVFFFFLAFYPFKLFFNYNVNHIYCIINVAPLFPPFFACG